MRKYTWYAKYSDWHGGDDFQMEGQPDFKDDTQAYRWLIMEGIKQPALKTMVITGFRLVTADAYFDAQGGVL